MRHIRVEQQRTMNRILSKIPKLRKKPGDNRTLEDRITNETVAEHREQILAGGRRFKYPIQYSRNKLVINSILISITGIVIVGALGWWQLYVSQNTSKFMYRLTQLVPVPVAQVDGESVPYADYLKRLRSSIHYLQEQNNLNMNSVDGKKEVDYRKRQELNNAIRDAYVRKIARENKVSVSEKDVSSFIKNELSAKQVSETAYEKTVLNNYYDWSMSDYRGVVKSELLKRKVSFAIDAAARDKANRILAALRASDADFTAIAKAESDDQESKSSGGDSGALSVKTFDPNGVIRAVSALQPGQITDLLYGTDGYYVAKLTSKNDQTIQFQFIKVSINELNTRFQAIKTAKKIKEFIQVQNP